LCRWRTDSRRAVSIHAPAGGATRVCGKSYYWSRVSIHAPAGGATCRNDEGALHSFRFNPRSRGGSDAWGFFASLNFSGFNPRSRGGSDWSWRCSLVFSVSVSIHAPAGGATLSDGCFVKALEVSIHAPAGGATQPEGQNPVERKFQSTLPRGERQCIKLNLKKLVTFQSTLPRGERPSSNLILMFGRCFNPRSRGGSDEI